MVLQMQLSLDGFVAGPQGEMDWITWNWDDALKAFVDGITQPIETILIGRKLAEGFIPYWASVAADVENPEQSSGRKFTDTPKVVASRTLTESPWPNTRILKGDLRKSVEALKAGAKGEIMVYGGAELAGSLIAEGLIDKLYLFVNPVAIGRGLGIFNRLEKSQAYQPVRVTGFDCGIVLHELIRV